MAYTFHGFGAMNYGQRDFRPDGSYDTTMWFVCFYVPIVPIHSKRLRATGEVKYFSTRARRIFATLEKTKPNLNQVVSVYAFFALEIVVYITAVVHDSWLFALPGIPLLALPWLLRRRALDRMKAAMARQAMGFSPELSE
jgi:hypothetical protein